MSLTDEQWVVAQSLLPPPSPALRARPLTTVSSRIPSIGSFPPPLLGMICCLAALAPVLPLRFELFVFIRKKTFITQKSPSPFPDPRPLPMPFACRLSHLRVIVQRILHRYGYPPWQPCAILRQRIAARSAA